MTILQKLFVSISIIIRWITLTIQFSIVKYFTGNFSVHWFLFKRPCFEWNNWAWKWPDLMLPMASYMVTTENDCHLILLNNFCWKYDVLAINSFVKEWNQPGIYTLGIRCEDSWFFLVYIIIMRKSYTLGLIVRKERPKYHHWRNSARCAAQLDLQNI